MATEPKKQKLSNDDEIEAVSDSADQFILPDEILIKIFSYLPISQWPVLESVNKAFRRNIFDYWRKVENIRFDEDLPIDRRQLRIGANHVLNTILEYLIHRAPNIRSLGGFRIFQDLENSNVINERFLRQISRFPFLENVSFAGLRMKVDGLADFLNTLDIRNRLKELDLDRCFIYDQRSNAFNRNNQILRQTFGENPNLTPLRLKNFYYGSSNVKFEFINAIDTSLLTSLNIHVYSREMTLLIRRCPNLERLECNINWDDDKENSEEQIIDHINFLEAITTTCENLSSLKLYSSGWNSDDLEDFRPDFIDWIGDLGRLNNFNELSLLIMRLSNDDVAMAIANDLPNLIALELHVDFCHELSLTYLVTKLNRLKKLNFGTLYFGTKSVFNRGVVSALAVNSRDLESLQVTNMIVYPNMIDDIVRFTKLRELSFDGHCQEDGIKIWMNLFGSKLESLKLVCVRVETIELSIRTTSNLRRLSLEGTDVTDSGLKAISTNLRFLEEINLSACRYVTTIGVQAMIDRCLKLKRIIGFDHTIGALKFGKYRSVAMIIS